MDGQNQLGWQGFVCAPHSLQCAIGLGSLQERAEAERIRNLPPPGPTKEELMRKMMQERVKNKLGIDVQQILDSDPLLKQQWLAGLPLSAILEGTRVTGLLQR